MARMQSKENGSVSCFFLLLVMNFWETGAFSAHFSTISWNPLWQHLLPWTRNLAPRGSPDMFRYCQVLVGQLMAKTVAQQVFKAKYMKTPRITIQQY
uniref:Secreted protein n=1 Tax=Rhipicephalus appendiculatus TaxID=34631 RepID=A0A131YE33_RHIAP